METKYSFTKSQIADETGFPARTIQFYTEAGIITPGIENPKGKGKNRKYSNENKIELLICKELIECGIKLEVIKQIVNQITDFREHSPRWLDARIKGEYQHEIVYCLIYNPFSSDFEIKFHFLHEKAGALTSGDGEEWTIQKYTRRSEGYVMTSILDLSQIIKNVAKTIGEE